MNKTEQKAFDKLIKDAAHKSVLHFSDVSFDLTQSVFLELCKAVRSELDTTIKRLEDRQRRIKQRINNARTRFIWS